MGKEIERKFLVRGDGWRSGRPVRLRQAYLSFGPPAAVRVRLGGGEAWINVKSRTSAIERIEFEYRIPEADGEAMLGGLHAGSVIDKTRYHVAHAGHDWEVDEFHGDNAGLVVAEIELSSPDEAFERPPWLGEEVSEDDRYLNTSLARRPFTSW